MLIRVVNISTSDSTRSIALANNPAIDPPCWTPGNQGPQAFGCGISHSPSGTKIASLTPPHTTAEPLPLNADSHTLGKAPLTPSHGFRLAEIVFDQLVVVSREAVGA